MPVDQACRYTCCWLLCKIYRGLASRLDGLIVKIRNDGGPAYKLSVPEVRRNLRDDILKPARDAIDEKRQKAPIDASEEKITHITHQVFDELIDAIQSKLVTPLNDASAYYGEEAHQFLIQIAEKATKLCEQARRTACDLADIIDECSQDYIRAGRDGMLPGDSASVPLSKAEDLDQVFVLSADMNRYGLISARIDTKAIFDLNEWIRKTLFESVTASVGKLGRVIFSDGGDGGILVVPSLDIAVNTAIKCMEASANYNLSKDIRDKASGRYFRIGISEGPIRCQTFVNPGSPIGMAHMAGTVLAEATRIQAHAAPGTIFVEEGLARRVSLNYERKSKNWTFGPKVKVNLKPHEQDVFEIHAQELKHCILGATPPKKRWWAFLFGS